MPRGLHVGKEVGPPEAVDGLLGVPDQKQDGSALPEDILEDGILNRVRVLEFIDEGGLVASPDRLRKLIPPGLLQGMAQPGQEVIEGLDVPPLFPGRQLLAEGSGKSPP